MGKPKQLHTHLPPRVRLKHGAYYYVENSKWTWLGRTLEAAELSLRAIEGMSAKLDSEPWAQRAFRHARKNAKRRDIDFAITCEDVRQLEIRSGGRCMLTGIPFDFSWDGDYRRRPWVPSIDRKDSRVGYTSDNCWLICSAVNYAKNEWGMDVLQRIVDHMKRSRFETNDFFETE